jgi:8-oxo-dGTP diphosphatase
MSQAASDAGPVAEQSGPVAERAAPVAERAAPAAERAAPAAGRAAPVAERAAPGPAPAAALSLTEMVPTIPASAGAMIFDQKGRLLILKPNYKAGWTIPGGVMEADGETPWEACQREVLEECGLTVRSGRLACVDFRRPRPGRTGGMRFLFDCGRLDDEVLGAITVQAQEISEYRIVKVRTALPLLSGPIRRRVRAGCAARTTVYLEEGRPVEQVR